MSIPVKIQDLVEAEKLWRYSPPYPDPDFKEERLVLMTSDAWNECPPTGASTVFSAKALANMRATLQNFIGGGEIEENLNLKCLEPKKDRIWEIRVYFTPQVRMFGWFAAPDVFIVSHCVLRDQLADDAVEWSKAIRKCMRRYNGHLKNAAPFEGRTFTDYITRNGVAA